MFEELVELNYTYDPRENTVLSRIKHPVCDALFWRYPRQLSLYDLAKRMGGSRMCCPSDGDGCHITSIPNETTVKILADLTLYPTFSVYVIGLKSYFGRVGFVVEETDEEALSTYAYGLHNGDTSKCTEYEIYGVIKKKI